MDWNLYNTVPAICILAIFYGYYVARPRLPVKSKKTFVYLLIVEESTLLFDLIATNAITAFEVCPSWFSYLTNMIYFMLFFTRVFLFFLFAVYVTDSHVNGGFFKYKLGTFSAIASTFVLALTPLTNWIFYIDNEGIYHSGPLYNILYVDGVISIISAVVLILNKKNKLTKNQLRSTLVYNFVLMIGLMLRFTFPKVLLYDMFCIFAIMVIYLAFENPEYYLNNATGLFNRESFNLVMEEFADSDNYNIVALSIKDYNVSREVYGWQQMDRGLKLISNYLLDTFKKKKLFYLRDGNFAIITFESDTDVIVKKIRDRFEQTWVEEDTELFLYVGFVTYDSKLKARADNFIHCMRYALNEVGRIENEEDIAIDETRINQVEHQISVVRALDRALEHETIEVYLQPVVRASDYEVVGAEALARIIDPDIGFIPPNDFIPIAEKNGSIGALGKQVFEKTCKFMHEHNDEVGLEWINVNLSPIQCMNKKLSDEFNAILSKYNIPSSKLHLEITEQSIIDSEILKNQMQLMVENGFKFALDDYGSGYSNAICVVSYPLSNIKIDRGIIVQYFENPSSLLPNEIKIFLDMNFSVTAEGVETLEMAEKLKEFGCDFLQGYYFSKPLPMDEFVKKYSKKQK